MKRDRRNQKPGAAITKSIALVEKWRQAYERAIEGYENSHPHWRIEVLVSLIKWSLRSLKHYIENPRESKISWADPFVELHFPVGWNWSPREEGDTVPHGHLFGQITSKNVATEAKAHKTLARIMVEQLNAVTLADVTNWACYEKRKNYYLPVFPVETTAKLISIKGKRARQEAFEELVRPFSIGGAYIDYGDRKLVDGAKVPKRAAKQLANIGNRMDIPAVNFNGEHDGQKFRISLVFLIHPLIADYDQKKAYHPITVGLAFLPEMDGDEIKLCDPGEWSQKDQEGFWDGLLKEVEKLAALLIPKPEVEESVILSVNSQLKVPASWWHAENRTATMKLIADAQAQAGEIVGFGVQAAGHTGNQLTAQTCPVCGWIHDASFTQIKIDGAEPISLSGLLPDILRTVHRAHEKGLAGMSTKDKELTAVCGGYYNPCKAFHALKRQREYRLLFDTSRRGTISLRGAIGKNWNKSEAGPE
jgi:hypothetical protein